ncbi:hypothetical protein GE09DRAFT_494079 [Coniochaeta sp. 2T2.1]|nr:hypothetical protein GE09DRAFT_494079 [Coniochaeta sp. 2T2.1]
MKKHSPTSQGNDWLCLSSPRRGATARLLIGFPVRLAGCRLSPTESIDPLRSESSSGRSLLDSLGPLNMACHRSHGLGSLTAVWRGELPSLLFRGAGYPNPSRYQGGAPRGSRHGKSRLESGTNECLQALSVRIRTAGECDRTQKCRRDAVYGCRRQDAPDSRLYHDTRIRILMPDTPSCKQASSRRRDCRKPPWRRWRRVSKLHHRE